MKKRFSILIPLTGFLLMTIAFNACKKTTYTNSSTPVASLMAFNLVPDSSAVGVTISGNNFTTSPLSYIDYTGNYRGVNTGTSDVTFYNFSTGAAIATASQLFADSAFYSAFFVGTTGNYKNVIVKDDFDSLTSASGQAYVRYVNAIPDSTLQPTVTISSNGNNVFNTSATFPSVSNFKGITPGDISINPNYAIENSKGYSKTLA